MLGVKPYVSFNGSCAEAIDFYKTALGAEVLFVQKVGDSPMSDMGPADAVMHCTMKIGDTHLMMSDNMGRPMTVGNNISLAIGSDDIDAAKIMFDAMSDGGSVIMPMQETYWAECFGMLTDKFGVNWMFNCEKTGTDHQKATA
ncbi:MAG: glyoxalase/bleomycin resistance/extradiol dioxygenase family protein [Acidobacteria bacterium]|nr:glyoxalase/bleomycin resistance/extradiol dioxygenase family protein [Acidobacteriota bacterium]